MTLTRPPVPPEIVARLRAVCRALPETREEPAWVGTRWRVRDKTFAHVLMIAEGRPQAYARAAKADGCVVTFRTLDRQFDPVDFEAPPFFRPVWFPNIVGLVLDEATDWDQLAELLKVSYRVLAPKTLVEALDGATR
jgi:predicted DNA-binding protein (MmcQ/YjbR family)